MQVDKVIPFSYIGIQNIIIAWQNKFYFKINRNNYISLEEK